MTPAEYWGERDKQNATRIFEYSERQGQMITRWFGRAAKDMDDKIRAFYRKYADENGLTYAQAKAELNDKAALSELAEHYDKLLAVAPSDPVATEWLNQLHTAKRINREEFLKAQLNLIASEAFLKYEQVTAQTLTKLFEECYYKSLFDQQQFMGFGSGFNRLSTNFIATATSTAWRGKNYSERIWGSHRVSLARYLNRIITTGVIEGTSNQVRTAELQKAMSMSAYDARRLIRTESNYVANRGSLMGYREFGTEKYEFLATLDFKTSVICRDMDGEVFLVSEAKPGINMAPLHPFCRSTSVPYIPDDEFDRDDTRAARDGQGNTYRVPADMKYRDWYDKYVKGNPAELLAEQKYKHGAADTAQWAQYKAIMGKDAPSSLDKFQNIKYTDADSWDDLKAFARYKRKYPSSDRKYYEVNKDIQILRAQGLVAKTTGFAVAPVSQKITGYGSHALQRMWERSFGTEDAQAFIQNALVEFRQYNETRSAYYAKDGVAVVVRSNGEMVTGWDKSDFDEPTDRIMEVLKKHGIR